jgi:DNA polymerase-2
MWLFDAYPVDGGMAVWLIDAGGRARRVVEPFEPTLYAREPPRGVPGLWRVLRRFSADAREVERRELFSGRALRVWQVRPRRLLDYSRLARALAPLQSSGLELFHADIPLPQMYFYERGLFPLARCEFRGDGRLAALDSGWDADYALPPLRTMLLRLEGADAGVNPAHGLRGRLETSFDDRTALLEDPRDLAGLLRSSDPDLVITEWGDAWLIEALLARAPDLPFNRDPGAAVEARAAKSYFSYGRIVHKAGWRMFRGRWHIDIRNSFIVGQAGFDGLYELARMSAIPVQLMARTTTGTAITSMQLACAFRRGILIPWQKRVPEDFKTADELLATDKGGLVYSPEPGLHERVGEIDFASMFPAIMARCNVSPETVNCACCPDAPKVSDIEHRLCRRRRGLVPEVLEPIVAKRLEYKRRAKLGEPGPWEPRVTALKWILVVCFGYLGYKNARFGRIEAHECVTALSREKLLVAKEVAEARGYRVAHAIVDSLYLRKPGATEADYEALNAEIERATGLPCGFEGIYDWIAFFPARQHSGWGVPNRFLGRKADGELKIRGIEARRHDTCLYVRRMQGEMIERLARARGATEYRAAMPDLETILRRYEARLAEGRVPVEELAISRRMSRRPEEYVQNNATAAAARRLAAHGVRLSPGETIQLVLTEEPDRAWPLALILRDPGAAPPVRAAAYRELLRRAWETLQVGQRSQASLSQLLLPYPEWPRRPVSPAPSAGGRSRPARRSWG